MDSTALTAKPAPCNHGTGDCAPVPEFRRNQFVYGQLMGVADFRAEQSYFREKQRLHNRCFHGYGVVCGLLVHPVSAPQECAPSDENKAEEDGLKSKLAALQDELKKNNQADTKTLNAEIDEINARLKELSDHHCANTPPTRIVIDCGIALDCEGNELVVRRPLTVDLWRELSAEDRKSAGNDPQPLYISLCYCEQPIDPIRPVLADQCGAVADCTYGKVRESVRVHVSLAPPKEDTRCDSCCTACGECCLLLARIDDFRRGYPVDPAKIHNDARRRLGIYQSAVITNINWMHGGDYAAADAETILGTNDANGGIEIHFSRPILTSSLRPGVVELWRVEGGAGRSSGISQIFGEFAPMPGTDTTMLRFRQTDEEKMDYGDRILIQVRCEFLLDRCCRPVDGANVGGRVPPLPGVIKPQSIPPVPDCPIPPWGYAPWTSGSGVPGSNFESWITIAEPPGKTKSGAKT
jgi:hypothetical protein